MKNTLAYAAAGAALLISQSVSAGMVTLGWEKQYQAQDGEAFTFTLTDPDALVANGNVLSGGKLFVNVKSDLNWKYEYVETVGLDGTVIGENIGKGSNYDHTTASGPSPSAFQSTYVSKNTRYYEMEFDLDDSFLNTVLSDSLATVLVDLSSSVDALSCYYFTKVKLEFNATPGGVITDVDDISPVPLPAAAWLFGTALLGFAGARHRARKQSA